MEIEVDKTLANEIKLSEKVFQDLFARSVSLGERSDACMSPDDLAGAIPEIWDHLIEIETAEKLYLSPLISSTILNTAIVEKTDLLAGPGDTLWISKIGQLEAPNDGALPQTHQIEGQEIKLDLDMVSFRPTRFGVGTCWTKKTGRTKMASSMSNHSRYRVNSGKPKSLRYGNPEPSLSLRKDRKVQRLELRRFTAPGSWLIQDEEIVQVR